jgi:hypothetical protein
MTYRCASGCRLSAPCAANAHAVSCTGRGPHVGAPPFRTFGEKLYDEDFGQRLQDGLFTIQPERAARARSSSTERMSQRAASIAPNAAGFRPMKAPMSAQIKARRLPRRADERKESRAR